MKRFCSEEHEIFFFHILPNISFIVYIAIKLLFCIVLSIFVTEDFID
jgi:hypothetical protein